MDSASFLKEIFIGSTIFGILYWAVVFVSLALPEKLPAPLKAFIK